MEFDPATHWYNASVTIAAGWIRTGGVVSYGAHAQPPDRIRAQIRRLGLNPEELEKGERPKMLIWDYYTATLGQKSKESHAVDSVKISEQSIEVAKSSMIGQPTPERLRIWDDASSYSRFNDEKIWIEFELIRVIPVGHIRQSTGIGGIIRGLHSDSVYKRLEAAYDGVIDLKLDEAGEEPRNMIRIRSMKNVGFDGRWHSLKISENLEVTIVR